MSRPLIVGTAGHIDHGKTALVRALSGRDTDRLAEEKRRGISIELGFAPLDLGERRLSLIDVPGHERFVRTMIAGASGIDLFLLVIAADDGVMPQTREHLTVLRALGVEHGVMALNKCDAVEKDARMLASSQARELVPSAPLVEVSARTEEGLEALQAALLAAAARVERASAAPMGDEEAALHIDRAFMIAGRGTVVTGTLWSGTVRRGDRLTVLPQGIEARVREVQIHDHAVECAESHQRVAINLAGVRRGDVRRGDVLASAASTLAPAYRLDVELSVLREDARERERVQVHHGTREAPARVVRLADDLAQLRLEAPLIASAGDRLVLRRIAPPDTLGGGHVLDANPQRHGPGPAVERLRSIQAGELDLRAPMASEDKEAANRDSPPRHQAASAPAAPTPLALRALALLRGDGDMPRSPGALAEALGIERAGAVTALDGLVAAGRAVRLKPDVYYPHSELESLCREAVDLIGSRGSVTLAEARNALGVSRKYAQALLEHLDASRITLRHGESRTLRPQRTLDEDR